MGARNSTMTSTSLKRKVIWCDTEGGIRNVPLWDVTCIEETTDSLRAERFCNVSLATKTGRQSLYKYLPAEVYRDSQKSGSTCVSSMQLIDGVWEAKKHVNVSTSLNPLLAAYLTDRKNSVMVAWNMRGHDRHVLNRAVGENVVNKMVLFDALPWFRSRFKLPKNTMSSKKPGTPRAVFAVRDFGSAHASLADASHMREVVLRAAYCWNHAKNDLGAHKGATALELFQSACSEIESEVALSEWHEVADCSWMGATLPKSVLQPIKSDRSGLKSYVYKGASRDSE